MTPLNRFSLDVMASNGCQNPGCRHSDHDQIILRAQCHPMAALEAIYQRSTGMLKLRCHECRMEIAHIEVAEDKPNVKLETQS